MVRSTFAVLSGRNAACSASNEPAIVSIDGPDMGLTLPFTCCRRLTAILHFLVTRVTRPLRVGPVKDHLCHDSTNLPIVLYSWLTPRHRLPALKTVKAALAALHHQNHRRHQLFSEKGYLACRRRPGALPLQVR